MREMGFEPRPDVPARPTACAGVRLVYFESIRFNFHDALGLRAHGALAASRVERNARDGIRTHGLLRERVLSPPPLAARQPSLRSRLTTLPEVGFGLCGPKGNGQSRDRRSASERAFETSIASVSREFRRVRASRPRWGCRCGRSKRRRSPRQRPFRRLPRRRPRGGRPDAAGLRE